MSPEGAKNVSCPWLSPLQGWGSLTIAFTGEFVDININIYIYIYIYIYIWAYFRKIKHPGIGSFVKKPLFEKTFIIDLNQKYQKQLSIRGDSTSTCPS